jgi:biofilm protein TabA
VILDTLDQSDRYTQAHPGLAAAFDFLRQRDLAALAPGRHAIDGERVYALASRGPARAREAAPLEGHRRYIDVQVCFAGSEEIGWSPRAASGPAAVAYDASKDIEFFTARPAGWVPLQPGMFAVFFPEDAHAPMVGRGELSKVVVKVAVAR